MTDKLGIEIIKEQIGRETYYHVDAREFELAEVKLLIDAIQSSKFITQTKSRELIGKIKGRDSKYCAEKGYVAAADASVAMCEQTYKIGKYSYNLDTVRPASFVLEGGPCGRGVYEVV